MGGERSSRMFEARLGEWAAERGYALAIAGMGVLEEVRKKLEERRSAGLIEAGFFEENLTTFRYLEGIGVAEPGYVVMVAVPSPVSVLRVRVGDRKIDALIPPTYIRYNATFADVLGDMKENALGRKTEAGTLKAPLKSLAVRMGLVSYGRNNITYVPGRGSGFQLCGYIVGTGEGPVERDVIAEGRETVLERCASCRACVEVCPTGAIREDRFLISAERCFTLLSESLRPIPAWARPPKALCLIGCMACQQACPENKGRLKTVPAGLEFTAEETEAVMEAGRRLEAGEGGREQSGGSAAFASARAKFDLLGMTEDLDAMGRNLEFFLSWQEL
jgi:epoxyqueuosine reductase